MSRPVPLRVLVAISPMLIAIVVFRWLSSFVGGSSCRHPMSGTSHEPSSNRMFHQLLTIQDYY